MSPRIGRTGGSAARAFGRGGGGSPFSPFIIATGGTITTSGNYKIHTFLSSDTFTVTGMPVAGTVEYLVVAGGGGGGGGASQPPYIAGVAGGSGIIIIKYLYQ